MNAVMTQVTSVDHIRRSEMIKRRNAQASSKIRQAEAQIGLNKQAVKAEPIELNSSSTGKSFELQKRYERTINSYSFQVQAKYNGFKINWPSFFKVA